MLESIYCCCGLCKTDSRCPEKGLNVTNCSRILQSRSDSWTNPKTFRNWRSRTLSAAVPLANQNTSQWNVLRRNLLVLKKRLISRVIARNSQTPSAQTNTIQQEDNYYAWDNSKFRAESGVLYNYDDQDFNRGIYLTTSANFRPTKPCEVFPSEWVTARDRIR